MKTKNKFYLFLSLFLLFFLAISDYYPVRAASCGNSCNCTARTPWETGYSCSCPSSYSGFFSWYPQSGGICQGFCCYNITGCSGPINGGIRLCTYSNQDYWSCNQSDGNSSCPCRYNLCNSYCGTSGSYRYWNYNETPLCGSTGWYCGGGSSQYCGIIGGQVGACCTVSCNNSTGCGGTPDRPCSQNCGSGDCAGTYTGTCQSNCSCANWSACSSDGSSCGNCGTCSTGSCTGQGCSQGSTQSCGNCGSQLCSGTCTWGSCTGQGCSPGATQSCGNCGSQLCSETCTWGTCTGQGCSQGSTQSCGNCGTQTCSGTCTWGSCSDKKTDGQTCSVGGECCSNNCVDGFCCNSTCSGDCETCNMTGQEGICTSIGADDDQTCCEGSGYIWIENVSPPQLVFEDNFDSDASGWNFTYKGGFTLWDGMPNPGALWTTNSRTFAARQAPEAWYCFNSSIENGEIWKITASWREGDPVDNYDHPGPAVRVRKGCGVSGESIVSVGFLDCSGMPAPLPSGCTWGSSGTYSEFSNAWAETWHTETNTATYDGENYSGQFTLHLRQGDYQTYNDDPYPYFDSIKAEKPPGLCCGDDGADDDFLANGLVCLNGGVCGDSPGEEVVDADNDGAPMVDSDDVCGCNLGYNTHQCNSDGDFSWDGICCSTECVGSISSDCCSDTDCATCGSGDCVGNYECTSYSCTACNTEGNPCADCGLCSAGSCSGTVATDSQACGSGDCAGTQTRDCQGDGTWGTWGSCSSEGSSCNDCGLCSVGSCTDTGATDSQACGSGVCTGTQTRDCQGDGTWGTWGSCSSEGSSCGKCGFCSGGSCGGEGICDPGQPNNNPDCPCPADACIVDDYYDYPDYGDCNASCNCECEPIIYSSCSFPNKPQSTSETWDYSAWGSTPQVLPGTSLILHWFYSDPESNPQASYEIWVDDDSGFTGSKFNIIVNHFPLPGPNFSYTLDLNNDQEGDWLSQLNWNFTYHWKVRVKNSVNPFWSEWSDIDSFITRDHANPYPDFIPLPQNPAVEEVVMLIQDNSAVAESLCYNDITGDGIGEEHQCQEDPFGNITYEWDFDYPIGPTSDKKGNASTTYNGEGSYTVRLLITDNTLPIGDNFSFHDVVIDIGSSLPEWREVSPF